MLEVRRDGLGSDAQLAFDLRVGQAIGDQPGDLELPRRQRCPGLRLGVGTAVHFERAWLDADSGKVFCLATGPSKEAVFRIHERAGHPPAEVYEISAEVA